LHSEVAIAIADALQMPDRSGPCAMERRNRNLAASIGTTRHTVPARAQHNSVAMAILDEAIALDPATPRRLRIWLMAVLERSMGANERAIAPVCRACLFADPSRRGALSMGKILTLESHIAGRSRIAPSRCADAVASACARSGRCRPAPAA
jgi:hypothetical protein